MKSSIDYLMKNYPIDTDSIESIYDSESYNNKIKKQIGGIIIDKPTGGFPLIYLCEKNESSDLFIEEEKKKREYTTHKTSVSIKDILENRRKATPIINI